VNLTTIVGVVVGFGALMISLVMEGGDLLSFVKPSAALIVFGGTFGATLMSFPGGLIARFPKVIMRAFINKSPKASSLGDVLVGLSERARREGLLALEEELTRIENPLLKKGIMLVVDGTDPELVRSVLESDIAVREREAEGESGMLEAMGGFAPTMGIIGTVMGLVNVLAKMEDPSKLGESIAVAFIATLYGIGSANMMWLPLGTKLKKITESDQVLDEMIMEGVSSIQSGENPRILQERLSPYLAGAKKGKEAEEQEADGIAGRARQEAPGQA
jgi:chemotaxis protein MotA